MRDMQLAILLLFLGVLFSCSPNIPTYNVIYITIEDAMPTFGCYGDSIAYTPYVDQFAKEALLFEDVHCQVALCTPSRTSILTGIRPSTSGIVKINDDWQDILPNAVSLPRHFRENGYYTAIAGKIHDYRNGGMDAAYTRIFDTHGLESNELALEALHHVSSREQPFFLAIGYAHAHDPWAPSISALNPYTKDQFSAEGLANIYKNKTYNNRGIVELLRNYYGEISEADRLIGTLLENIKSKGLYENTIILVGALDHGYNLGHRGRWGKGNTFDNETQVPFLLRVPENPNNGKRSPGLVELVDIYPTLVDLCGLPQPKQRLEGISLRPLLENPVLPWKKAAFTHRAYAVDIIGIKTKEYTLIDYKGDSLQLFHRQKDPLNLINIAGQNPEVTKKLLALKSKGWENALPD
ncbi:MAG: sulfatase-like hydrolase/transferase [Bacteroidota bacterium]